MTTLSLKKHYQRLLNDLDEYITESVASDELSKKIISTEYVRIYLTGNLTSKQISVYVEVFPAVNILQTNQNDNLIQILKTQIMYMEYLLNLSDKGFTFGFIREEGIWYGTKNLETEPTEELCKIITPPKL
ncbi:MAG: hypothetical protein ACXABU_14915 [Candidatus Hodarchaeales archaeon]|jgi:hypothetical protein